MRSLRASLIEGYLGKRQLDMAELDLFLALRATTYLGWIIPRMAEEGAEARNARFIDDARAFCTAWLRH